MGLNQPPGRLTGPHPELEHALGGNGIAATACSWSSS